MPSDPLHPRSKIPTSTRTESCRPAVDGSAPKRIIACLDVDAGRVVKGIQFQQLRDAGDPAELAVAHASAGADEIVLLDITATNRRPQDPGRNRSSDGRDLFVPFTVGGGIRTLEDAAGLLMPARTKSASTLRRWQIPSLSARLPGALGRRQ